MRVTHGIHRPSQESPVGDDGHPPCWDETDLAGWQLLLPNHGCFTAFTALEVWGLDLPPIPEGCPVFVAMTKPDPRPLRRGVHTSRHVRPVPFEVVRGLRVATVAEALLACARSAGLVDLVALLDQALHRELVVLDELDALARSRRPGARRLREAMAWADGRAESVPETLLRLLHVVCGVDVEPQRAVWLDGVEVARVDLWLVGARAAHEFDGDEHEKAPRRVKDLRRARRLERADVVRRGYTLGDVLRRPVTVLADADRALGRQHDPSRVRGWTRMLRESLFTDAGQVAFLAGLQPVRRVKVAADGS